ncbi:MAG: BlaI/MecI/CopY family transcriptional regulator [Candidatus Gastranaerophilaceae bacterium]
MIYGVLEIEIMNSIWYLQDQDEDANISVADIVEHLDENKVARAYTTIKTVMDRLVSKGVLVRYRNGKKFFYRSTVDKSEAAKKSIAEVSNQFFNGNPLQMLRFIEKECENVLV